MKSLYDAGGRFLCVVADDSLLAELQTFDQACAAGRDLYDISIEKASGHPVNLEGFARADRKRQASA